MWYGPGAYLRWENCYGGSNALWINSIPLDATCWKRQPGKARTLRKTLVGEGSGYAGRVWGPGGARRLWSIPGSCRGSAPRAAARVG